MRQGDRVRLLGDTALRLASAARAAGEPGPSRPLGTVLADDGEGRVVVQVDGMSSPWPVPRGRVEVA